MADDNKANYYRSKILTPIGTGPCHKLNLSLLDCIVTKGKGNCEAEFENFTECRNSVLFVFTFFFILLLLKYQQNSYYQSCGRSNSRIQ